MPSNEPLTLPPHDVPLCGAEGKTHPARVRIIGPTEDQQIEVLNHFICFQSSESPIRLPAHETADSLGADLARGAFLSAATPWAKDPSHRGIARAQWVPQGLDLHRVFCALIFSVTFPMSR